MDKFINNDITINREILLNEDFTGNLEKYSAFILTAK